MRDPQPDDSDSSDSPAVLSGQISWLDRWHQWREEVLGNARFQRWAARFPLTRAIAKRRAADLFDLCAGFVYSQTLLACVQLRLLERLRGRPQTVIEIALALEMTVLATQRLVDAAISLRLLERRSHDRIGLGAQGAALLANDAVLAMIEHHPMLYADLRDPVALLRGQSAPTQLSQFWAYARASDPGALADARVESYSALMANSQPLVAVDILDAYDMSGHQCLLDVGGGEGTFVFAAAARYPQLRAMAFDLPAVAKRARRRFIDAGLKSRLSAIGGDFLSEPLPSGADLVSLVRVIHDHDDVAVAKLLAAVHAALPPGGTVLIAEPLSGTAGADRVGDAYFWLYLWAMGSGQPRTAEAMKCLLGQAGFQNIHERPTSHPMQVRLLVARKC